MTALCNYKYFRSKILNKKCTPEDVHTLKLRFAADINSKRRLEEIETMSQLIDVLLKRDILSETNLEPLKYILNQLNDCDNLNEIQNIPEIRGMYVMLVFDIFFTLIFVLLVLPSVPDDIKERVYEVIMANIGSKWSDLARALNINEGRIDELGEVHKRISDRVREILCYYEKFCDQRRWKSGLLEALTTARRNDLRKRVQEIFDTH